MYNPEYLPIAKQDMIDIVWYISNKLFNPSAADRLADAMVNAVDGLRDFPYAHPVYYPVRPLKHEYRHVTVQNYLIFYFIEEGSKRVTVARVIYAKRNIQDLLE